MKRIKMLVCRMLIIALLLGVCGYMVTPSAFAAGSLPFEVASLATLKEWEAVALTNRERLGVGSPPVSIFAGLQEVAHIRADEITTYFSHARPNRPDWVRDDSAGGLFEELGMKSLVSGWGENIGKGYSTASAVVKAWKASPGHWANMDDPNYTHMGSGNEGNFWAQVMMDHKKCSTSQPTILSTSTTLSKGESIDSLNLALKYTCAHHGTCYVPVIAEMCTGFDPNISGDQTVTVSAYGYSTTVTVTVDGAPVYIPPVDFTDVSPIAWYSEAVKYCKENGLMNGVSDTEFAPESTLNRAMLATVLYRLEGSPAVQYQPTFNDVPAGEWYSDAIIWANLNGIVQGYGGGRFGTNDPLTREQLVTLLYRYAGYKGYSTAYGVDVSLYRDYADISSYAIDSIGWSVDRGILRTTGNYVLPTMNATRAECAYALWKFVTVVVE